ncbi:unnamed protein product [Pedinophyceae sp. YPF-701]|nr:unnamed protein product [Pedinophyceae sp. YPF-701]
MMQQAVMSASMHRPCSLYSRGSAGMRHGARRPSVRRQLVSARASPKAAPGGSDEDVAEKKDKAGAFAARIDALRKAAAWSDADDTAELDLASGDEEYYDEDNWGDEFDESIWDDLTEDDEAALAAEATPAGAGPLSGRGTVASRRTKSSSRRADSQRTTGQLVPTRLLPKVAIIGRPNVGKSALFNRIVGGQVAIVYDYPGVTRDRLYTRAFWGARDFVVVDTGGLENERDKLPQSLLNHMEQVEVTKDRIPDAIERQAAAAVCEADVLVFVVDGQQGPTAADEEIMKWIRRNHGEKPLVLAVNKCESPTKADMQAAAFWHLGVTPIPVSAISGSGTGDMLDAVAAELPPPRIAGPEDIEVEAAPLRVAIVGRPNVGKSSMLNAIVGEERAIVSEMSGTTRDAIDTEWTTPDGTKYTLVDTAGMRRRARVADSDDGAEELSVQRSLNAIQRADTVVLLIDAVEGVTVQDFRLAERIAEEGRACVVCVNKWDMIADRSSKAQKLYEEDLRAQLRPVNWAEVVFTCAKTGARCNTVLDAASRAGREHNRRINTATINMVIQEATAWRSPPSARSGKAARILYGTQAAVRPPTFVMFCNDPKLIGDDYRRYMERQLRENVGFPGTPLRILWRGRGGSPNKGR